jgi:Nif11 domain
MMAKQDAQKFLDYLSLDVAAQTQLATVDTVDGILDFGFTKGFVFTKDDLIAALKDAPSNKAVERLRTKLNVAAKT